MLSLSPSFRAADEAIRSLQYKLNVETSARAQWQVRFRRCLLCFLCAGVDVVVPYRYDDSRLGVFRRLKYSCLFEA